MKSQMIWFFISMTLATQIAHAYGENGYDSIDYYDPQSVLVLSKTETKFIPINRLTWSTAYAGEDLRAYQLQLQISDITSLPGTSTSVTLDAGAPMNDQDFPLFDYAVSEAQNDPIHLGFFTATVTKNRYLVHKNFDQDEFGDPIPLGEADQPFCLLVVKLMSGQTPLYFGFSPNMNSLSSIESTSPSFCEE